MYLIKPLFNRGGPVLIHSLHFPISCVESSLWSYTEEMCRNEGDEDTAKGICNELWWEKVQINLSILATLYLEFL